MQTAVQAAVSNVQDLIALGVTPTQNNPPPQGAGRGYMVSGAPRVMQPQQQGQQQIPQPVVLFFLRFFLFLHWAISETGE